MDDDLQFKLYKAERDAEKRAQENEPAKGPGYFITRGGYDLSRGPPPTREEVSAEKRLEEVKNYERRLRNVMPVEKLPFGSPPSWGNVFGPRGAYGLRIMFVHVVAMIRIVINMATAMFDAFITILQLFLNLTVFYVLIVGIVLYTIQLFWPYVLTFLLDFALPLTNVAIEVFNFVLEALIEVYRLISQMYNMALPFLFMIAEVILDIFLTVLQDVFDIIGEVEFQGFIQSLMEILAVLVEIALQILVVLIQFGKPILQALEGVIGAAIEVILGSVRILLPVVVWLFGFLFDILEPILFAVKALVAVFSWMLAAKSASTSRRLLALGLGTLLVGSEVYSRNMFGSEEDQQEEILDADLARMAHMKDIYNFWKKMDAEQAIKDLNETEYVSDTCRTSTCNHVFKMDETMFDEFEYDDEDFETIELDIHQNIDHLSRKLLNNKDDRHKMFEKANEAYENHVDKTTHIISRSFHEGTRNMVKKGADLKTMHQTMSEINEYRRSPRHYYDMQSIITRARMKDPTMHSRYGSSISNVRYADEPEHPHVMQVRFHKELKKFRSKHKLPESIKYQTGRKLLELSDQYKWDGSKRLHAQKHKDLEKEYAKKIIEQGKKYEDYHVKRLKILHTTHGSIRSKLYEHASTTLSFDNLIKHWNDMLKANGYKSMKEVYNDFITTHESASNFMNSLSLYSRNSGLMNFLVKQDENRYSRPFMHEWERLEKYNRYGNYRTRDILQDNRDQQLGEPGDSPSEERLHGFELISKTNCFSSPRNPLCAPVIPADFSFKVGQIEIPKDVDEDEECPPWINTNCLYCWSRVRNLWNSFRYILSALPPINFFLTFFTAVVPWMSWAVDWIFLVPKGETTTVFMFLCFVKHWYDIFMFLLLAWLWYKIIWPLTKAAAMPILEAIRRDREIAERYEAAMNDTSKESQQIHDFYYKMKRSSDYAWNTGRNWFPTVFRANWNGFNWYGGIGPPHYADPPEGIGSSISAPLDNSIKGKVSRIIKMAINQDSEHQKEFYKTMMKLKESGVKPEHAALFMNTMFYNINSKYATHEMAGCEDSDYLSAVMTALVYNNPIIEQMEDDGGEGTASSFKHESVDMD